MKFPLLKDHPTHKALGCQSHHHLLLKKLEKWGQYTNIGLWEYKGTITASQY